MKKILFIGNSFTFYFDVPLHFELLAKKTGREVQVEYAVKGGETFLHGADFETEYGEMVREKLENGVKYDRIILQEQSSRPVVHPELFHEGLSGLLDKIQKTQPQAEVVLYETWGYADDYAKWDELPGEISLDHDKMSELLHKAYKEAGEKFDLPVVYVGDVFHRIYREFGLDPYFTDRKHPSYIGTISSALTHFVATFPGVTREEIPLMHLPHISDYEHILDVVFEGAKSE